MFGDFSIDVPTIEAQDRIDRTSNLAECDNPHAYE